MHIASNLARLGNVRHLQIRYHLVRCCVSLGDMEMSFCVTEEMVADLFTKLVAAAQDSRLIFRFIPWFRLCMSMLGRMISSEFNFYDLGSEVHFSSKYCSDGE